MKRSIILALGFFCAAALACSNNNNEHKGATVEASAKSPEDSLYELVLSLHDAAMPKIGKLMGYQKAIQHRIDSLKATKGKVSEELVIELEILQLQLSSAEKQMNDWMEQFEPDPQMPTTEERARYFAEQEVKARRMKDAIFAALDSAAVYIKP
ncbi:MAG TPA: hypothetical protein VLC98_16510 [Phnomibacter sp.]|nr:hypothetical protein [Phnomibacter sp.]